MTRICIIAGNYDEAETFASGQNWGPDDWFYPHDEHDLLRNNNYHVIVIGTAGHNVPASWFNRIYNLAVRQGQLGR